MISLTISKQTLTANWLTALFIDWHSTFSLAFSPILTSSFAAFKRLPFDLAASVLGFGRTAITISIASSPFWGYSAVLSRPFCIASSFTAPAMLLFTFSRELLDTHFCFLASLDSSRRRLPRELNFFCFIHVHPHGSFYAPEELKTCSHVRRTI